MPLGDNLKSVLLIRIRIWIRILRIRLFLGLLDPDQLVRGMDQDPDQDPDPLVRGMDPRIQIRVRIHTKMLWIRNTASKWSRLVIFRKHSVKRCDRPGGRSRGGGWRGLQLRLGGLWAGCAAFLQRGSRQERRQSRLVPTLCSSGT